MDGDQISGRGENGTEGMMNPQAGIVPQIRYMGGLKSENIP